MSQLLLAIVIGGAFGAVLDRVGATNPNWIGRMLSLTNLALMKTILLAIGTGAVLMFAGQMLGLVDVSHMSVKAAYAGVFLGAGWAASGFCPGTGVCAAAAGRKDAMFFVAGGLLGAAGYMVTYPAWKATGLLDNIAGGKVTLGAVPGSKFEGLMSLSGDLVGLVLGLGFIVIAFALPDQLAGGGVNSKSSSKQGAGLSEG